MKPLIRRSDLSDPPRYYVLTRYRIDGNTVIASTKYDVTDQIEALLASGTGEPGLDVDLLARALRVVTRGSWSTPARRDPERQKRQDEAWLTRTAGAIAREYVALQGADPAYANDKGADPTPEPK
jgi:hypothetical protein